MSGRPRAPARHEGALLALAAAYVIALAAMALLRAVAGGPHVTDLASTPVEVAQGRVWTLVTSAFVVSGPPVPEIAGVAAISWLLIRRHGAAAFWRVAAAGHVGSAVLAYAGVGLLTLAGVHLAHHVIHNPDYGVSCVWAGVVGALGVSVARTLRRRRDAGGLVALRATFAALVVLSLLAGAVLVRAEHVLALLLGAGVMVCRPAPDRSQLRPAGEELRPAAGDKGARWIG